MKIIGRIFLLSFLLLLIVGINRGFADEKVKLQADKYRQLMILLDRFYLDSVNLEKLTEAAFVEVLSLLDPHSSYLDNEELKASKEQLSGGFFGIGIQFSILRDTLLVVATIPGGPSEKVGLRAGDRIIKVDDEEIAGKGIKNSDVYRLLKGPKGTEVKVYIQRKNEAETLEFVIIRDKIPMNSMDASYMIDEEIGYIKLNRFSATTAREFDTALSELLNAGMKKLILDLQGNGGGYLQAAFDVASELLGEKKLVVYTKGMHDQKRKFITPRKGKFESGEIIVIVNHGSASASEIVSGAIQDWDRGLVLGRRTFGKGLVQQEFKLIDGSAIRLTTSEYFTPSGRNIQKAYEGVGDQYYREILNRYEEGEMVSADSIKLPDSLKYKTLVKQRTVYGGGGITPDIFIPIDTVKSYKYYNLLVRRNVLYPYVIDLLDHYRDEFKNTYPDFETFKKEFVVTEDMLSQLNQLAEKEGIERKEGEYENAKDNIIKYIKASIARDLWTVSEFYKIINHDSKEIEHAIKLLKEDKTYFSVFENKDYSHPQVSE